MRVTERQMESRKRINSLESRITDAIGAEMESSDLSYAELITALSNTMSRWSGRFLKDEWETPDA